VELLLPGFNQLTEKDLAIPFGNPIFILIILGIIFITGLLAGLYPAFFLSSFNSVKILKGTFKLGNKGNTLRQGLVVFQFVLSMILIGATIVVYQQIQYIKNKDLGVQRENLVFFPVTPGIKEHFDAYRTALLNQPGIQAVSLSSQNPLSVGSSSHGLEWDGKDPETQILFQIIVTDYDFLTTAGIQLLEGRNFSRNFPTDTANILINEEAARRIGFENPVGQHIKMWESEGQIIGVVKDFHSNDLHAAIEPLVIRLQPENTWMVMARTEAGKAQEAIASLETMHNQFDGEYTFEYQFLDQEFERMYRTDTLIGKLATYFAIIAILISCLGLFGLAAYTAERRTKEIGVRKVLGASVPNLVGLISGNFTKLILIAFVIAAPISWYLMQQFLQKYAYRIDLSPVVFALTGLLALIIAWLTVSYQSIKAALANPIDSLRNE
jgi:hypothetical protein